MTDRGAVKDRIKGLLAGLDLEMPGGTGAQVNAKKIAAAASDGSLPEEVLDEAVRNVLNFIDAAALYVLEET